MKKIAFLAEKGGAGKTTQAFNFASYLAHQGKQVLLVDLDHQASLSGDIFGIRVSDGTSVNMFRQQPVIIHHGVQNNLDIVPASLKLEVLEKELNNEEMPALTLHFWLEDFTKELGLETYDYIIFDTHPDFGIINQNVVAACDAVISPLEPTVFGWAGKTRVEGRFTWLKKRVINPMTRETLIDTKLWFINSKIEHNTTDSRDLLERTQDVPEVIATINKKQLFVKSIRQNTPIVEMAEDMQLLSPNRAFFEETFMAYDVIQAHVDTI